jgi:predicted short-subunit dehydrogenase-like oxidoreductase (DUF2520 family)
MRAAMENLDDAPPAGALTGPVVRGDADTVRRHLAALGDEPVALGAYVALSRAALELGGGDRGEAARDAIAAALDAAAGLGGAVTR